MPAAKRLSMSFTEWRFPTRTAGSRMAAVPRFSPGSPSRTRTRVRFSIDSDAHSPGQLEWQPYGCDKAVNAGIEPERIINTLGADDLLAHVA